MCTMRPYELNLSLNDEDGVWLSSHGSNRYRKWDELHYSVRMAEYAESSLNRIQMLVNAVELLSDAGPSRTKMGKQRLYWLKED
ncbi:hypothetical protein N0V86_009865 [Didymella sp. IMI 355093]|nr:hypothetical protein N0V86_009865 [Didymella sp. IMI 355093]